MTINKIVTNRGISTLFTIKYTVMSLVSILHRLSGIFLFFILFLFFIYTSCCFFSFKIAVNNLVPFINSFAGKLFLHFSLFTFFFHILAGCRHIIMDFGFFKSLHSAKTTAISVIVLSFFYFILVGFFYEF